MLFFKALRELVSTYSAFENLSGKHIRSLGLTPGQFDVIATLGNQPSMTCKELAERTLMVKGNLTVILEALLKKNIISKEVNPEDGRSLLISLTNAGNQLFHNVFPAHLSFIKPLMEKLNDNEYLELTSNLEVFRKAIEEYQTEILYKHK